MFVDFFYQLRHARIPVTIREYLMLLEAMDGTQNPEVIETLRRNWAPMGEAGMSFWRRMFESGGKPG